MDMLLHKKNARSVANAFKERVLFRHGIPEKFVSDNEIELCNSTMKEKDFTYANHQGNFKLIQLKKLIEPLNLW